MPLMASTMAIAMIRVNTILFWDAYRPDFDRRCRRDRCVCDPLRDLLKILVVYLKVSYHILRIRAMNDSEKRYEFSVNFREIGP